MSVPYNLVYKHFYGRETLQFSLNQSSLKPFRRNHTYGHAVRDLKMGHKFTGFLTYQGELHYCLTSEYIDTFSKNIKFHVRKDVKEFSVVGKNIIQVLTTEGTVVVVQYEEQTKSFVEEAIKITQVVPMKQLANSYYLNVMVIDYERAGLSRKQINAAINTLIYGNRVDGEEM